MTALFVTQTRLRLLRVMYLVIFVGNALTATPAILFPGSSVADSHTVVSAMLCALMLLALVGIRYPLKMLPLLLWELLWKSLWMFIFARRMWLDGGLDSYASGVAVAVGFGLVLVPLCLPWRYLYLSYIRSPADPWLSKGVAHAQ